MITDVAEEDTVSIHCAAHQNIKVLQEDFNTLY
jgi:hypothetical protein